MHAVIPETLFTYSGHDHNVEEIVQHDIETYFEDAKIIRSTDRSLLNTGRRGTADTKEYVAIKKEGYVFLCFAEKMREQGKQNDYVIVVKPSAAVRAWFKKYVGSGIGSVNVTEPAGNVVFKSNNSMLSTSHLAGKINLDDYRKYLDSVEL